MRTYKIYFSGRHIGNSLSDTASGAIHEYIKKNKLTHDFKFFNACNILENEEKHINCAIKSLESLLSERGKQTIIDN